MRSDCRYRNIGRKFLKGILHVKSGSNPSFQILVVSTAQESLFIRFYIITSTKVIRVTLTTEQTENTSRASLFNDQ